MLSTLNSHCQQKGIRIEVHRGLGAVVAVKALLPIHIFDDDFLQAVIDGFNPVSQKFQRADEPVAMAAIRDAGLKTGIVEFAAAPSNRMKSTLSYRIASIRMRMSVDSIDASTA